MTQLTDEDKVPFRREITHKWSLTPQLYVLVFCLALGACVQGMDETVINGAQLFYPSVCQFSGYFITFLLITFVNRHSVLIRMKMFGFSVSLIQLLIFVVQFLVAG